MQEKYENVIIVAALDNKYRHSTLTSNGHGSAVVSVVARFSGQRWKENKNNIVHKQRSTATYI